MERHTIDFGIDLGTTNSTIAVVDGTDAKAIPNKAGSVITPSAVWIDKRNNLHVGAQAKERALIGDPENGDLEFKLRMGLGENGAKNFLRSGRRMLPEELSAEVLKSLKMDVQTNMGEEVRAAVVTVPAAFELPQTAATYRAACGTSPTEIAQGIPQIAGAGFSHAVLLLEPVAASLAYGFQSKSDNVYWLVYDFGGGTFDAALMRVRDGLIQVVNHDGDNHLGGKLLDWDIVTEKLVPALTSQYNLPDFRRGSIRWRDPIGKLKYYAEQAKIEVCRTRAASEIWIEGLCEDEDGKPVDFSFNLTPQDVQEVSRPFIERSLNLCRRTLKEKGISGQDLDRVLMVGGTTLNPWVREGVQSALNAKLDFSVDPVTAVARGAAIFAGIQTIPASAINQTERKGKWTLNIEHVPVGDVVDPDIGGKVQGPQGESASGCTIEFVDTKTKWRSGRVPLNAQGAFLTQLFAEEKRRCEYDIELCNATGTRLEVSPARITYTIGVLPDKPPIANSIGIRLANGDMKHYLSKGTQLPARGSNEHRTTGLLRHGNEDDILRINVLEGEHSRADMNRSIGMLKIRGADIRRDLPAGSEIEVKLSMNESQQVRVHVFIPLLDEDFEAVFQLQSAAPELEELRARAADQKARLAKARDEAQRGEVVDARGALAQIEDENMENEVDHLLAAAEQDPDARSQLNRRLLDLAAATYEAEQAIAWPNLVDQAQTTHKEAADVIRDHGTDQEKRRIAELWDELQVAIGKKDAELVKRAKDECTEIMVHRLTNLSGFETMRFGWLEKDYEAGKMTDSQRAKALVERGRKLIADNNQGTKTIKEVEEELKVLNRQLASLLPSNTSTGPVTIEVQ